MLTLDTGENLTILIPSSFRQLGMMQQCIMDALISETEDNGQIKKERVYAMMDLLKAITPNPSQLQLMADAMQTSKDTRITESTHEHFPQFIEPRK